MADEGGTLDRASSDAKLDRYALPSSADGFVVSLAGRGS